MQEVLVYEYPYSQRCMKCKHSEYVQSMETFKFSSFICHVRCLLNNGLSCPRFEHQLGVEIGVEESVSDLCFFNH